MLLDEVEAKEPGELSGMADKNFESWQKILLEKRDDRTLFEHLAVTAMRLEDRKLTRAAAQLFTLARLGLGTAQNMDDLSASSGALNGMVDAAMERKQPTLGKPKVALGSVGFKKR